MEDIGIPLKSEWTEKDFEEMGWHDNKIHAISFNDESSELSFDIDHIGKWVIKKKAYQFWLVPATLVFRNVYDINIATDSLNLVIL